MKIEPEKLKLVKLWDEEVARTCKHDFASGAGEVFEDGATEATPIFECTKCGQLRKPKKA